MVAEWLIVSHSRRVAARHSVKVSVRKTAAATVHWQDTELSDGELVRRARLGDAWARAALYHRYSVELADLAVRLLRDRDAAADVVQDTFVSAFETLADLRDAARVRGWLRVIAIRHVHRVFRRRRLLRMLGIGPAPAS